jgi:hypothetical protein
MVLCEWPLGNGLAEAEELAALARYPDGGRVASAFGRPRFAISVTWSPTAMSRMSCRRPSSLLEDRGPEAPAPYDRYLIDAANGTIVLAIPVANVLDGDALVLGELDAAVTTRRNTVRDAERPAVTCV